MRIETNKFGITKAGEMVTEFKLYNNKGNIVSILDYGCTIRTIEVPDAQGHLVDVSLGYNTIEEYENNDGYLGAVIGRYGNRIKDGKFTLENKEYNLFINDGAHHLHGGQRGYDKYVWQHKILPQGIQFYRVSPHMEEGYPGELTMYVTYEWTENDQLAMTYMAVSDATTILNLTNHTYFNLSGENSGDIHHQTMQILASQIQELNEEGLSVGTTMDVKNTPFDFTTPKVIGLHINDAHPQLQNGQGYDHNFIIDDPSYLKKVAVASSDQTKIQMSVYSTQPGVQFYTGNFISKRQGKKGEYASRQGFCLETQHYPDAIHYDHFPTVVLEKGVCYQEITIYAFDLCE